MDSHNWEDLGPYPNWKGFIHSKVNPNLSQPLSMHHLIKYSHHFETYVYEFQHPPCRVWRPYIPDSNKYSNYDKTHICILLYVGIYIFPYVKVKKSSFTFFWVFFWNFFFKKKGILFPKYISLHEKKIATK